MLALSSSKPKIFFDTQICINAANGAITSSSWNCVVKYIAAACEYHISPLTYLEIEASIARGDKSQKSFAAGQERLRRLYLPGQSRKFLPFVRYFIGEQLFGMKLIPPPGVEDDIGLNIQITLWAQSQHDVEHGVFMPYLTRPVKLRHDRLLTEFDGIKERYVTVMKALRKRPSRQNISPEDWVGSALSFYGLALDSEAKNKFIDSLPAAYEFEKRMLGLSRNQNYDLAKHTSDLVDGQQLYYLSDPRIVFVTDDSDHKRKLKPHRQNNQIMTFKELMALAERNGD